MTLIAKLLSLLARKPKQKPQLSETPASANKSNDIMRGTRMPVLSDYFKDYELGCRGKNCCGNAIILDPMFKEALLKLRITLNLPMIPTSVCRCVKHNANEGGKKNSFHLSDKPAWENLHGTGAIDVKYTDIAYRNTLARIAYEQGWRIGLHKAFLHLDIALMKGHNHLPRFFKYQGVISNKELAEFQKQILND